MNTLVLSRANVSAHMQALHLLRELRAAFTSRHTAQRSETALGHGQLRAATLASIPAWSVSVHGGGRRTLQLHGAADGQLLAVMEAGHLTTLVSSVVSALAADVLAVPEAKNVAILGSGPAASSALKALRLVRSIEQVWFYEPNPAENFQRAHRLQKELSMAISAADSVPEATLDADIVVLTGGVALESKSVKPGTHLTVLDAGRFERSPINAVTLERARRFCDAEDPGVRWGLPIEVDLGRVLAGLDAGRTSLTDVTLCAATNPPWLELLGAWHVFEGARHDEALTRIDLEA